MHFSKWLNNEMQDITQITIEKRSHNIYAEKWNENTGLWGIGKEIANKDGIQARWSGWANALKAGGTWAPGQDMALRLLNPSLMVPRSISMSAHASLSCYGGCTKPRRVNNKPAWPSISSITDLALICPRAGENHWTPIMLHFRTINSSTFLRFKDLTHEDISKWNPRLHAIYS